MGIIGDKKLYDSVDRSSYHRTVASDFVAPCKVVMKGLKRIRKRIGLVSRSSSGVNNDALPVRFHAVHGSNITLHKNRTIAKRQESFCRGVTFSDRPIHVDEKIYIKLIDKSDNWSGVIRFGYTSHDPTTLKDCLPKYVCPDLTNRKGFWAKAVNERLVDKDVTLYFYVNKSGTVYYGVDGRTRDEFFQGVDVSGPLWAIIDVYGNSTAIELVNARLNNCLNDDQEAGFGLNDCLRNSEPIDAGMISDFRRLGCHPHPDTVERCVTTCVANGSIAQNIIEPADSSYVNHLVGTFRMRPDSKTKKFDLKLTPLPFHERCGLNVRLSNNKLIATRLDSEYCRGYVFTPRPISTNEFVVVEVLKTDTTYMSGLAFGVTSENPARINVNDLPEDADELIDRSSSFIVYKNVANTPSEGDNLIFSMSESGEIKMKKNGETEVSLFHVEKNVSYWWFFDLYGTTTKIRAFSGILESRDLSAHFSLPTPGATMTVNSECAQRPSMGYNRSSVIGINGSPPSPSTANNVAAPPVLVVKCYSDGYEPINIILQNQPPSSRIIAQNPSQMSSQIPNVRCQLPLTNNYAELLSTANRRECFDNTLADNGKNREYQLQEWAKCNSRNNPISNRPNECTVCYEKPVDAVLYTCGHMCLCFDCARELWRGRGDGHCPICRAVIRDVIRTYKS